MNVLIVAPEFPPRIGGMEVYAAEIARVADKRTKLTLLTNVSGRQQDLRPFKFRAKIIRLLTGVSATDTKTILEVAKSENAQLVHIMNAGLSSAAKELNQAGIATIVTAHGKDFLKPWVFTDRKAMIKGLKAADKIIAVSDLTRQRLHRYGIKERIVTIPNGANITLFRPSKKAVKLLAPLNIPTNNMVLFTSARIHRRKNIEAVIKIMPSLQGVTYLVTGPLSDQGYYRELKEQVDKLVIGERVIFTGPVDSSTLNKYYNLADVYVLPSLESSRGDIEGFGIAYLEAAACGKPIIASKYAGAAGIIKKHKLGFVVDPKNKKELLNKIKLLLRNKKLREQMGRNGRRLVVKEYNWENVAKKTLQVYKEAIRKKCY